MAGMLYLVATPIGNLGDMTQRAIETLREVDIIAAEDTRNSLKLINHFDIHTELTSYHEFNKYEKAEELLAMLEEGKNIALITDAGTPAISDPGEVLVKMCANAGITVTSLPGPCACITALILSGLSTRRFCFEGFLPTDKKERKEILTEIAGEKRTMIFYEAPHHLVRTLGELYKVLGERNITLCRELTKKFEEIERTTFEAALDYFETNEPRGEYVIVVEGKSREQLLREKAEEWRDLSIKDHMNKYESAGYDHMEAIKKVARDRGVGKRDIYRKLLEPEVPMNPKEGK
ncbi:MAG: 16S rRNA (cytidine(1402)-2'-O)-methyltransferase [Lachnospiraceae bacterium]|nr:16S rRNA (cytidine(1402)-2'-O)-methyltransferase [Lachnospiraceae bacterium]